MVLREVREVTKTYSKIYGNVDTEEVAHYASVVIDYTLHPKQIQPEHIVITSPYFRTDERKLQHGTSNRRATEEQKAKCVKMRAKGLTYKTIGEALGLHKHTVARHCKGKI